MIFKIFFDKKIGEKVAFLTQNKAKLFKNLIITLLFEINAIFLPKIVKNRRKL
jgi:mRNA-degrading endonuclease RelE of RelBE toxin-antitoxin system